jgi:hypothetical protein
MTVRQRAKRVQAETEDRSWPSRRDYLVRWNAADTLLECSEFGQREPDVPDELRSDPDRWRDLLAPPDVAADIRARRADLLERRRLSHR